MRRAVWLAASCVLAIACSARSSLLPFDEDDGAPGGAPTSSGGAHHGGGPSQGGAGLSGGTSPTGGSGGSLAVCGNGIVEGGEPCDDGNTSNGDNCLVGCALPFCGDGFLHVGVEDCDDGNTVGGDSCPANCMFGGPQCGNGVIEIGEACDDGPLNEDRWALSFRNTLPQLSPMRPFDRAGSAVSFYNYFSSSSHTGFEVLRGSRIFFYRNTNNAVLSLIMHHGIDQNTSGQTQPNSLASMEIQGLPGGTFIGFSDDTGELVQQGNLAVGKWQFQANSDGGVIAGFPFPGDWDITVLSTFDNNIDTFMVLDHPGQTETLLNPSLALEIRARSTPSSCRTDCTVPKCGDGLLDAGETCDDGNTNNGDNCSSDCSELD